MQYAMESGEIQWTIVTWSMWTQLITWREQEVAARSVGITDTRFNLGFQDAWCSCGCKARDAKHGLQPGSLGTGEAGRGRGAAVSTQQDCGAHPLRWGWEGCEMVFILSLSGLQMCSCV